MSAIAHLIFVVGSIGLAIPVAAQPKQIAVVPVTTAGSVLTEEIIILGRTQPIPIKGAPKGCAVKHAARYCRPDKLPIKSVNVLEQRMSGLSTMAEPRIDQGCVVIDMTLAVAVTRKDPEQCTGGEAKLTVKLQVSVR